MSRLPGYPPHLWIEPYREVCYRVVWGLAASLVIGRDDRMIEAARELVGQEYLVQDAGPFYAAGQTYVRFVAGPKLKVKDLRHAY